MAKLNCPNCDAVIDTSEPHLFENEIYSSDTCEHEETCGRCKRLYLLVADWEVSFSAIKIEV